MANGTSGVRQKCSKRGSGIPKKPTEVEVAESKPKRRAKPPASSVHSEGKASFPTSTPANLSQKIDDQWESPLTLQVPANCKKNAESLNQAQCQLRQSCISKELKKSGCPQKLPQKTFPAESEEQYNEEKYVDPQTTESICGYSRSRGTYITSPICTDVMGLHNRGTDCFVNSALNSLYFVPQFYHYFLNVDPAPREGLTANLKSFVTQYGEKKIYSWLITWIRNHSQKYDNYEMGSSYEFILSLLESLDAETRERLSPSSMWGSESYGTNKVKNELIRNQSGVCQAMHDIFSVLVEERKTCSRCQQSDWSYSYRRSLFLDIVAEESSLETSLQAFLAERTERFEDSHFCTRCNQYQVHTFQSTIKHIGSALIVHLQRFHSPFPHSEVFIPDTLNIPEVGGFSLCSAVCHIGRSPDSGHYTCCAKASNGWMRFDDSRVFMEGKYQPQWYLNRCTLFIYVKEPS